LRGFLRGLDLAKRGKAVTRATSATGHDCRGRQYDSQLLHFVHTVLFMNRGREFAPNAAGSRMRNSSEARNRPPLDGQQLTGDFPNEAMRRQSLLHYGVVSSPCFLQSGFSMDELRIQQHGRHTCDQSKNEVAPETSEWNARRVARRARNVVQME
jgi:hypothetical protein